MVPVFVVGVMGASLANCVLAVAAYLKDKLAWRTARAADVMHGLVVFLVLVPASLVFYAIGGHLPGEAETEKNEAGSALEGRRAKRATWPIPPGPSLTSWGREATRSPLSPSRSGPQTRPQGEEVPGRRMAAFRVG